MRASSFTYRFILLKRLTNVPLSDKRKEKMVNYLSIRVVISSQACYTGRTMKNDTIDYVV
jgi:hypothetical protein